MTPEKEALVIKAANQLLKANNTVTTLEVKTKLRSEQGEWWWDQDSISQVMRDASTNGQFTFVDNGTFRVYSGTKKPRPTTTTAPAPIKRTTRVTTKPVKAQYISRRVAKAMMSNNKGHFFSVIFTKKNQTERTMNCQYLKDQTGADLGYIKVREASLIRKASKTPTGVAKPSTIRNVNLQTLKQLSLGGVTYKIR